MTTTGVSLDLLPPIINVLAKLYGDRSVSPEQMNELIRVTGDLERLYRSLPASDRPKKAARSPRKED